MKNLPFTIRVEKDGDEYHAWSPELTGCHTHGRTASIALENLKDAIQLYLETVMEEEITRQTLQMTNEAKRAN